MKNNGANLGFEQTLWQAADKLRSNMDAAEYKHVVLGLIFLKYISDAFEEVYEEVKKDPHSDPEDKDEYISRVVFWVPQNARWNYLKDHAKDPKIGELIDQAMEAIEAENPSLKLGDISIYGQESNQTTWRLCKMNLAIRRIEANIQWGNTFRDDKHKDVKADFIIANQLFNDTKGR
ncbi:MAG: type I restriction-modification system subunit M N-terminal domain-containing protein [Bacteroidales bacterium]